MSGVISAIAVATVAVGAGVYSANQQSKATKYAADKQAEASQKALAQQNQAFNKQNQKGVDMESILERNTAGDTGSTLLTGAQGVGKDQLSLAKGSSLLGGGS